MSPDAVHEPSLPGLPDRPFLGFIFLLSICHSDFTEDAPAAARHRPRNNPPVCELHRILDKEAASPRVKAKDTGLYHWVFLTFQELWVV